MPAAKLTWPRVITRGPLKGRTFESQSAYMKASAELRKHKPKKGRKLLPGEDYYFELTLVRGRLKMTITGDPRSSEDIDALLEALGAWGTEA